MDTLLSEISNDLLGYLAALLILSSFCTRDMIGLRMLAILANAATIVWACQNDALPFLLLHALLLPINAFRLAEAWRSGPAG